MTELWGKTSQNRAKKAFSDLYVILKAAASTGDVVLLLFFIVVAVLRFGLSKAYRSKECNSWTIGVGVADL